MALTRPGYVLRLFFAHPSHSRDSKKNRVLLLLLIGLLPFSFGACSAGIAAVPAAPTAPASTAKLLSPTPTSLPAGTVLYQADWSHGLTGWSGRGWKVAQGQLLSDSSGTATFTIPYRPVVSDYAIEIRVQMIRSVPPYGGYYEIIAPKSPGRDGYQAGILDLKTPGPRPFGDHPQAQAFLVPSSDMSPGSGIPQDYEPGSEWHTYRVEVRDNEVRLLDNGTQIGRASSQQTAFLSNGPIEFSSALVILRVSNLRIVTL